MISQSSKSFPLGLGNKLSGAIATALAHLKASLQEYLAKQATANFFMANNEKRLEGQQKLLTKMWRSRVENVTVLGDVAHHMLSAQIETFSKLTKHMTSALHPRKKKKQ